MRRFDATGRHLNSFGGIGEGPGEFTNPTGILETSEGVLLVWATFGYRAFVFDIETGDVLHSYRLPAPNMTTLFPGRDGNLFATGNGESPPPPMEGGLVHEETRLVRWEIGSDSVTEISRFPGITWEMVVADGTVRPIGNQWYLHGRNTAPADSGLWTFDTRGWELERLRWDDGVVDRVDRFDEPVLRLDQEVIDAYGEASIARAQDQSVARLIHESVSFPETIPTHRAIASDAASRIWIRLFPHVEDIPRAESEKERRWVVLGDEGREVLGYVTFPPGRDLLDADLEGVLLRTTDDTGVAVIERWSWESP